MPGGSICSVAICKSNSKKAKQMGEHLMFFTFPSDPAIQKEWIRKCYRKDTFQPKYKRICSKHFEPEDYEDAIQARVTGSQPKKLKKNAIPSVNLRPDKNTKTGVQNLSKRAGRLQHKQKKQLVEELMQAEDSADDSQPVQEEELTEADNSVSEMPSCSKDSENYILKRQLEQLQQENALLKDQLAVHVNNEEVLRKRLFEVEKKLRKQNSSKHKQVKLAFKDA